MQTTETMWAIVLKENSDRRYSSIFGTTGYSKKEVIEIFEKKFHPYTWKNLKKIGYRAVKVQVTFTQPIR